MSLYLSTSLNEYSVMFKVTLYSSFPFLYKLIIPRWSHEYQEACIEKLERFLTGFELNHPENDLANAYAANLMQGRHMNRRTVEQQISYEGYVHQSSRLGSKDVLSAEGFQGAAAIRGIRSPEVFLPAGRARGSQDSSTEL